MNDKDKRYIERELALERAKWRAKERHDRLYEGAKEAQAIWLAEQSNKIIVLVPPGTKWDEISIKLISEETVRITVPDVDNKIYTYQDLNMHGKKSDAPGILWGYMIRFCLAKGIILSGEQHFDEKLSDNAKRLNKHLTRIFGIEEKYGIYTGHYKTKKGPEKKRGYETKIHFSSDNQFDELRDKWQGEDQKPFDPADNFTLPPDRAKKEEKIDY